MKEFYRIFIESYEETRIKSFDRLSAKELEAGIDDLANLNPEDLLVWQDTVIYDLEGKTPLQYLESLDFEGLMALFKTGAALCDWDLPDILLKRMESFGERTIESLLEQLSIREEDQVHIKLYAIRLLGMWKVEKAIGLLIEEVLNGMEEEDVVTDEVLDALITIGEPALQPVISVLDAAETIEMQHESLMEVLAGIGEENKQDAIYSCLKNCFLKMENKPLGAELLQDYGDIRSIAFLRGFIKKNAENLDVYTMKCLISTVHRMGGEVSDLIGLVDRRSEAEK